MGEDRDVTLPSGISITQRGDEVTYLVPAQWSFDVVAMLVVLPFFALVAWSKVNDPHYASDRTFILYWIGGVVWGIVFCVSLLVQRHRLVATERTVTLRSRGLLGVRSYECPRAEFRVGDFYPRGLYGGNRRNYRWGHVDLYFGSRRVRTMRGWNGQIYDTIEEWRRVERPRDMLTVPRAGSTLRVITENRERALEVHRPLRTQSLWIGALSPLVFATVIVVNVPLESIDLAFGIMLGTFGVALFVVFLMSVNLLTSRSRINVTRKYVALSSRSMLGSSSYTCARADFTIGEAEAALVVYGLRLNFGSESVLAMLGSRGADAREAAAFLEAWLTEPT